MRGHLHRTVAAAFAFMFAMTCMAPAVLAEERFDGSALVGEWAVESGNELVAYFLFPDGTFYYIGQNGMLAGLRYIGSGGLWRLEGDYLSVKITRQFYYRDSPKRVDAPSMTYDYGDSNPIRFLEVSGTWRNIGSFAEYRKLYSSHLSAATLAQQNVYLTRIIGGRLTGIGSFYRSSTLDELGYEKVIIDNFSRASRGKEGDWSPGG